MASTSEEGKGELQQLTNKTHIRVLKQPIRGNVEIEFVWLYSEDVLEFGEKYMEYLDRGYQPIDSGAFQKNKDGSTLGGYVVFRHEQHIADV